MICHRCRKEFPEKDLQLSHDVPRYMFEEKKEADWYGRHYLCVKCHDIYERLVFSIGFKALPDTWKEHVRKSVKQFSQGYFKEVGVDDSIPKV